MSIWGSTSKYNHVNDNKKYYSQASSNWTQCTAVAYFYKWYSFFFISWDWKHFLYCKDVNDKYIAPSYRIDTNYKWWASNYYWIINAIRTNCYTNYNNSCSQYTLMMVHTYILYEKAQHKHCKNINFNLEITVFIYKTPLLISRCPTFF